MLNSGQDLAQRGFLCFSGQSKTFLMDTVLYHCISFFKLLCSNLNQSYSAIEKNKHILLPKGTQNELEKCPSTIISPEGQNSERERAQCDLLFLLAK